MGSAAAHDPTAQRHLGDDVTGLRRLLPQRLRAHRNALDVVFVLTAAIGHVPSARLRHRFYRGVLGARIAAGARISGGAEIRGGERLVIGPATIVGHDAILDGRGGLTIGTAVNLSSQVAIWTADHDPRDPAFGYRSAAVSIGDRAWLSFRSTILPGVTVGEGAVVAAGAVVTKDVPPFTIVAGVPAVPVGERPRDLRYDLGSDRHLL
jgi:acetyltransferase-like isoleucine patch superfamily enzyme